MLEIGRITKPHGLKGDLIVDFFSDHPKRTVAGSLYQTSLGGVSIRKIAKHKDKWRVSFNEVESLEQAQKYRGLVLHAEAIEDDTVLFVHELIGKQVVDQYKNQHGRVESVLSNPASDLLELKEGVLVPLTFYVKHDKTSVFVEVPEGLL